LKAPAYLWAAHLPSAGLGIGNNAQPNFEIRNSQASLSDVYSK
jgi:hypothetical protein